MRAIGIDLGTTNSVAAVHDPIRKVTYVLDNDQARAQTPSVVGVRTQKNGEEQIRVGQPAVQGARNATSTIFSIKRLMGRTFGEPSIAEVQKRFDYEIVPTSDEDARVKIRMGKTLRTPIEISSLILGKVWQDAVRALGDKVTHTVITVPAYFEIAQRAATREAAEAAGLIVKRLIDEPTAAAIAFGMQDIQTEGRRVLVYDLGGGTFDISLLQMIQDEQGRGQFHVVGAEGDNWLGGDDFDHLIVDKVIEAIQAEHGIEPPSDHAFRRTLKEEAEKAKWELGQIDVAEVNIPYAFRLPNGGPLVDILVEITRDEFNRLIAPMVENTMTLVDKVLKDGNFTTDDVTDVLLVGGSTLVPCVRDTVTAHFGSSKIRTNVKPMECVALGAAILADAVTGLECPACAAENDDAADNCHKCGHALSGATPSPPFEIYEQTAMALGIAAVDGDNPDAFVPIIPKGTPYPLPEAMTKTFTAAARRIRIPVHEGVDKLASKNRVQGIVETELPEGLEPNSDVEVSFNYDRDRVVTVIVRVPGTTFAETTSLRPQPVDAPLPLLEGSREDLEQAIDVVEDFVSKYGPYIEPWQLERIKSHLTDAKRAYGRPDDTEHRRYINLLYRDMEAAGLATNLYFADIAADRARPADSARIRQSAEAVRDAHKSGNDARRVQAEQILVELVERELESQSGGEVTDLSNLLRTKR